jgi:hypothetical protein
VEGDVGCDIVFSEDAWPLGGGNGVSAAELLALEGRVLARLLRLWVCLGSVIDCLYDRWRGCRGSPTHWAS